MRTDRSQPLDRAIWALGGVRKAAQKLGVTTQAVSKWRQVPLKRIMAIVALTGLEPYQIRPDLYKAPGVVRRKIGRAA